MSNGVRTYLRSRTLPKSVGYRYAVLGSGRQGTAAAFDLALARWAVAAKASMVDLGGNTAVVRKELALNAAAKRAGIAIVPDCGMGPGGNITLAGDAVGRLAHPRAG